MLGIKNNQKILKFVFLVVIPIIFLLFFFFASLILNKETSFSVLRFAPKVSHFSQFNNGSLLSGGVVRGEFISEENNLGIVNVRFENFIEDYHHDELITFKIKDLNSSRWFYENTYKVGYLSDLSPFSFGFPTISESKGKKFVFELISSSSNPKNFIQLSNKKPIITTSYQYSKAELKNPKTGIKFLYQKALRSFGNPDFVRESIVFITPLVVYLFWLFNSRKKSFTNSIPYLFLGLIYVSLFFPPSIINLYFLFVEALWVIYLFYFKAESKYSFRIAFILFVYWVLLTYFKLGNYSDVLNLWTYSFMVIGTIHLFIENRKR